MNFFLIATATATRTHTFPLSLFLSLSSNFCSKCQMSIDELPPSLVLEILSRLTDSTDLARCRVVSKTFNSLSRDVRSFNLFCSMSRYLKSRSPETRHLVTPFKTIFKDVVRLSAAAPLHSVSLGVDKSLGGVSFDDVEDESDDMFLTDCGFMKAWLPLISRDLKSLSISDFWVQSCWRRSQALSLISSSCEYFLLSSLSLLH